MSSSGRERDEQGNVVSRRDFLRVGGLSVVGVSVAPQSIRAQELADRRNCIFLLMTGGASPFETFDPKPGAPAEIRGPLRSISTAVPGVAFSESLPRLAERADRFAVLRSLSHEAAPIHETGLQMLQTGRLVQGGARFPSFGSVIGRTLGTRTPGIPPYVVLPRLVDRTGVDIYRGQQAGFLGSEFEPLSPEGPFAGNQSHGESAPRDDEFRWLRTLLDDESEPESMRRMYGETRFGRLCLQARQLIESGVRTVTVNLFDSLSGQITWDCHGRGTPKCSNLFDYRDTLCPAFDRALSALLDDLQQRGLLDDTLVVATGEFGRTPKINADRGRDHWPGVWSAVVAGGGTIGGRVIGASDSRGSAPSERPIAVAELTATIYHAMGLRLDAPLATDGEEELPLVDSAPILELFA